MAFTEVRRRLGRIGGFGLPALDPPLVLLPLFSLSKVEFPRLITFFLSNDVRRDEDCIVRPGLLDCSPEVRLPLDAWQL